VGSRSAELSLLAVVTGASLLLAEAFLWIVLPVPLREGSRSVLRQSLPGLHDEIVYERNEFGFRSLSMRMDRKPQGVIRVLCLGASTTDQPTQSIQDTWCAQLETNLNRRPSKGWRVETASFGRGGWTAADDLAFARDTLRRFDPDVVILLLGINDLTWHGGPSYHYSSLDSSLRVAVARRLPEPAPSGVRRLCERVSQLCRRAAIVKRAWAAQHSQRTLEWHSGNLPALQRSYRKNPFVGSPSRPNDPFVEFCDAVDSLVSYTIGLGVATIVLGQPVLWSDHMSREELNRLWIPVSTPAGPVRPSGRWLQKEMTRYNNAQKEIARRHGATFVDLDPLVPKTVEYYFDDCHFTDAGSRLLGTLLTPVVAAEVDRRVAKRKSLLRSLAQ
jgi:lysophospholipase L1-like esterase